LELCCNDYKWNVENFISFPEYLVACHLDLKNSSYEVNKQLLFTVMILIDSSFMCLLHVLLSVTYALMKVKLEHLRSWETCVNAWCCLLCYLSMIDWVMFKLSIAKYLSVFSVNYACLAYCCDASSIALHVFTHLHLPSHLGTLDAPREGHDVGLNPKMVFGGSIPNMEEPSSAYMEWRCSARWCKLTWLIWVGYQASL
jgi:hypothetical protein